MSDDTRLKERLQAASSQIAPPPGELPPVLRRARRLRARRWVAGAVAGALILAAVVVPIAALRHLGRGAGLGASPISELGLSAEVPAGWHARILDLPGLGGPGLQAASGPLPEVGAFFDASSPGHGVRVGVTEISNLCPCGAFQREPAVAGFRASDWYRPDPVGSDRLTRVFQNEGGYVRLARIGGRSLVVWAKFPSRPAPPALLQQANALLDSVELGPKPPPRPPWSAGARVWIAPGSSYGSAWSAATGESPTEAPTATAWSLPLATSDLTETGLAGAFWFYPLMSVDHLPRDGVIVVATSLPRGQQDGGRPLPNTPMRFQLSSASVEQHWEGAELPRVTRYTLQGRVGDRYGMVQAYFGTPHPTASQRALAQTIVDQVAFAPPS